MPTSDQQHLIDQIGRWVEAEPNVEALWLAGSLGKGGGDAFSDVDLLVLAGDGGAGELSAKLARTLGDVVRPVLVNSLYGGRVLNVVTEEWRRFDLTFVQREDLGRYNAGDLTAIFNKGSSQPPTRPHEAYRTPPGELLKLVNEFLRVFGLLSVGVGREEYDLALSGIDLMRRMTFDLMLEENGIAPSRRGGALHRNPLLTEEQRQDLRGLPPLVAERASVIEGSAAFARIFLPRARRLAAEIGMVWPGAFEDATLRHLRESVGLSL
jgi:predicted nucleotidyltransferase